MPRSKEEREQLYKALAYDYHNGLSLAQLERRYDLAASYINRILKREGVALRERADQTKVRHAWGRTGLSREQTLLYRERLAQKGPR